jgi:uncharacterized protein (TIGR03083 family)
MEPTVADYRELIRTEGASLLAQLERLSDAEWTRPSPCGNWDLLDVIVHLQLGTMVHTRMVESGLAGGMEPTWSLPEGVDPRAHFQQVHRDAHAEGPAPNLALLRERLAGYDAALAQTSDADLEQPAWFYGLPGSTLRRPIAAFTNDLIVHASDIRRPLELEPAFSAAGARFTGRATLAYLPMFTQAALLGGVSGVVRQTIDGQTSTVTLGPDGIQVSPDAATPTSPATSAAAPTASASLATGAAAPTASASSAATPAAQATSAATSPARASGRRPAAEPSPATRVGEITVDGATWTLLVWRQIPPADAERAGHLQIAGDRALVEAYLRAIKTP